MCCTATLARPAFTPGNGRAEATDLQFGSEKVDAFEVGMKFNGRAIDVNVAAFYNSKPAVAGAARDHPGIMVAGLLLSVLGALALVGGQRSLDGYLHDMRERGQQDLRQDQALSTLGQLASSLSMARSQVSGRIPLVPQPGSTTSRSRRF